MTKERFVIGFLSGRNFALVSDKDGPLVHCSSDCLLHVFCVTCAKSCSLKNIDWFL